MADDNPRCKLGTPLYRRLEAVEIDGTRPETQCNTSDKYRRADRDKAVCCSTVFVVYLSAVVYLEATGPKPGAWSPKPSTTHSCWFPAKECQTSVALFYAKQRKYRKCFSGNMLHFVRFSYFPFCQSLFFDLYSFIQKERHFREWV